MRQYRDISVDSSKKTEVAANTARSHVFVRESSGSSKRFFSLNRDQAKSILGSFDNAKDSDTSIVKTSKDIVATYQLEKISVDFNITKRTVHLRDNYCQINLSYEDTEKLASFFQQIPLPDEITYGFAEKHGITDEQLLAFD